MGVEPIALTAPACDKLRAKATRRVIRDTGSRSLFLIVAPSGSKSWVMRFRRPNGKPGKMTLGPYTGSEIELKDEPEIGQPLTLAAARALAATILRQKAANQDPIAEHKAHRHRQRLQGVELSSNTFAAAARHYVKEYAKPHQRRWVETARVLGLEPESDELLSRKGGLVSRWAERPISSIDADDIWAAIDEARQRGIPGAERRNPNPSEARARSIASAISGMFRWCRKRRIIKVNPCVDLDRPQAPKARDRALSDDEIRWFWKACGSVNEPFGAIFKLLLLSGARLNEVAGMSRDEIDADGRTWRLPGSRTKNGKPHIIALSPLARDLIGNVKNPPGKLIFSTTGVSPVSGWSRAKRGLDALMLAAARDESGKAATIAPWVLHDLRRSCVTGMAELGIRPDVIELVVNHASGSRGGIAGIYNRSELLTERRAALERWSAHLENLASDRSGNVVDLTPSRTRRG
jgi:integrase